MFSTKLGRAAHRASSACPAAVANTSTAPQCLTSVSTRRSHQRRPSSSKASCPPDSTSGGKPAPAGKTANSGAQERPDTSAVPLRTPTQKSSSKGRSRSGGFKRLHAHHANKLLAEPVDRFAGLPSVPSLQNLNSQDLGFSQFFALHRPLSLASPIPPPSSPEAFNSIFSRQQQDVWENGNTAQGRPEDIIITIQHTIDDLEGSRHQEENDRIRWEIVYQGEVGIRHLDGAPRPKSLDELVAQFQPFRTPPPPVAFLDEARSLTKKLRKARKPRARLSPSTASTADGTITEIQEPQLDRASIRDPSRTRQPYIERIRRRRQAYLSKQLAHPQTLRAMVRRAPHAIRPEHVRGQTGKMQLISVKRQRKLKMKKHKYKKLMKRTRNLRRRLDRA